MRYLVFRFHYIFIIYYIVLGVYYNFFVYSKIMCMHLVFLRRSVTRKIMIQVTGHKMVLQKNEVCQKVYQKNILTY